MYRIKVGADIPPRRDGREKKKPPIPIIHRRILLRTSHLLTTAAGIEWNDFLEQESDEKEGLTQQLI